MPVGNLTTRSQRPSPLSRTTLACISQVSRSGERVEAELQGHDLIVRSTATRTGVEVCVISGTDGTVLHTWTRGIIHPTTHGAIVR